MNKLILVIFIGFKRKKEEYFCLYRILEFWKGLSQSDITLVNVNMASRSDTGIKISEETEFKDITDELKQQILDGKDKKNTIKATKGAMKRLHSYLHSKELNELEAILTEDLPDILLNFYLAVRPKGAGNYANQSMKCIRAALNRYFKAERGIDIIKNELFVKTNEMFRGVLVHEKKIGKGVTKSIPKIKPCDFQKIGQYFDHDYMNFPNPKKLQENMIFFTIYYFCRRGRENLYEMTTDTFQLVTETDGTQYVIQAIDELDRNHGPNDTNPSNDGRMYEIQGRNCTRNVIFYYTNSRKTNQNKHLIQLSFADQELCPIKVFKLYTSKLNKNVKFL